jgi:hypothetical protein
MRKLVWTPAVVAALAILACSSSNKGSGNSFPYSGPSCSNGAPGATNAACSSCGESACSSATETTCINTTCSSYFKCFCNCAVGDGNCILGCTQSSDCMSCLPAVTQCYQNALATTCASQCGPSDAGTSSSSSGGGSSGGGSTTGMCATLGSCCSSIPGGAGASQGCTTVANTNNQTACQLLLSGLQDAGVCH